jgi:hypothetical protein
LRRCLLLVSKLVRAFVRAARSDRLRFLRKPSGK